ncbi:MAG TPA: phosphoribosyltransferase [Thermoplasmata archaeon]|nr:phosphoribosyltransferase [Thermoplasmata archaeon]
MAELPRCRVATWRDIDRWADAVAGKIRASARIPQAIVALTRGGWVHARLLADRLGVKRLIALQAAHWGVTATPSGRAELTESIAVPVAGLNVLVADDITDTGESLALATAHVRERGPERVETATLLHIAHSALRPDYFAEEIPADSWAWVVFPWNYWEDLRTLAPQALAVGGNPTEALRVLRERCGLSVPRRQFDRAIREGGARPT